TAAPAGGAYTGSTTQGGVAISLMDVSSATVPPTTPSGSFSLSSTSLLDLKATFSTSSRGGLIYDYYNPGYYKFAALLADTQQVVLGHYTTKSGFVLDEVKSYTVTAGTQYALELTGKGSTVSLTVNGTAVLSHVYNAVVVDGKFGLISVNGSTTFSQAYFRTDDNHFPVNTQVQHMDAATGAVGTAVGETSLTSARLAPIGDASIAPLPTALSLDASAVARLRAAQIEIGDLFGLDLGVTFGNDITISRNAAGWGWFIDPTPGGDSEFRKVTADGVVATPGSPAYGAMDL